jgi:diamine N-acetyltransferase
MNRSDFDIRMADAADAADIAALAARTFINAFAAANRPEDIAAYVAEAFSRDTIECELRDTESDFLLLVREQAKIGYAKLRKGAAPACIDGPEPVELERIYIDAGYQGGGLGGMLVNAAIRQARHNGHRTVWLGVWERNTRARQFYERHGFTPAGTKCFVLGSDRQTDLVMCRPLA